MKKSDSLFLAACILTSTAMIGFSFGWGVGPSLPVGNHLQTASVIDSISQIAVISPSTIPSLQTVSPPSLTILIAGDIMLDRHIRAVGEKKGYDSLFASTTGLFKNEDVVVANLEGPVTSSSSRTLLQNGRTTASLAFTFATSSPEALVHAGIQLVSLANNHTDNYGRSGFDETLSWLDAAGLGYFGNPWNDSGTEKIISKNGITIAFVGYNAFGGGTGAFKRVKDDVARLSAAGNFVVVMPHWGEEYVSYPSDEVRAQAKALVGAGASAIIGSHPHVIGDHEFIQGVPVFYSLGNFIFDQYFSAHVMKGNLVELTIKKDATSPAGAHISGIKVYETSLSSHEGPSIDFSKTIDISL
jgi:poly-gamma-glutamate synthesis protein (capsule biosynthesis protein)